MTWSGWPARRSASVGALAGPGQVVPGGLDQQPAGVAGAGLGDRALAAALAGLVEGGHQAEPGGQLRGPRKRPKSPISRQSTNAVSVSMPRKQRSRATVCAPLALEREPREPLVERVLARDQAVDGGEASRGRRARSQARRSAAGQASGDASSSTRSLVDAAVQQQQLRDAMAAAHQIAPHLLAAAAR